MIGILNFDPKLLLTGVKICNSDEVFTFLFLFCFAFFFAFFWEGGGGVDWVLTYGRLSNF